MAHSANKLGLFDPQTLDTERHFLIAYSGGSDSTALLHFCAHHPLLKHRIRAIHINHQLQEDANTWQSHCQKQCKAWQIECVVERANLEDDSENTARNARRQAYQKHLKNNETLLTAHHQQDQVETVLFRLFRGTGLKGLGGIKENSLLPSKQIVSRPLLKLSKDEISDYLSRHQLSWVQDPSNLSNKYSRNHIRNAILPDIIAYSEHAPGLIATTAERMQRSHELLMHLIPDKNPLEFNDQIDTTFLHHWLQKNHVTPPAEQQLDNFITTVNQAASHKSPLLSWHDHSLMAWQNHIYLLKALPSLKNLKVNFEQQMTLPCGGILIFSKGLPLDQIDVCYGVQGEKLKMTQHTQHKMVKKLHQEHKTPPWVKAVTPFIYHQNQLMAVGDWNSSAFDTILQKNKCQYSWQKPIQIL